MWTDAGAPGTRRGGCLARGPVQLLIWVLKLGIRMLIQGPDTVFPCAVGVTDLDELSELGKFAGKMEDEAQSPPCCYVGDDIDFWDPVMMAKELGCRVDELPVYYGGDLWNPDDSDIGYSDCYDDQSELSDYEDLRDFLHDEWLGSCEFHAPDESYFAVLEVGKASSPVSGYTPGIDMAVSVKTGEVVAGFGRCICFDGGCYFRSGS